MRFAEVNLRIALVEGKGFASVADWRAAHIEFWTSRRFAMRLAIRLSRQMTTRPS
jgi:uncharacterized protein YhfF